VRVFALLHDLRARSALHFALGAHRRFFSRHALEFSESWQQLQAGVGRGLPDVVVVNPWDEGDNPLALRILCTLLDSMEGDRIVVYVPRASLDAGAVKEIQACGFRWTVFEGVEDERYAFRRMLGLATARVLVGEVGRHTESLLDPARNQILVVSLAATLGRQTVDELALGLGMTARELRAALRRHAMPPPREILRWGCLCHALGLRRIGVRTTTVVSHLVGYEDATSLCRLYRDLLGCPAGELAEGEEERMLAQRILESVAGREKGKL